MRDTVVTYDENIKDRKVALGYEIADIKTGNSGTGFKPIFTLLGPDDGAALPLGAEPVPEKPMQVPPAPVTKPTPAPRKEAPKHKGAKK